MTDKMEHRNKLKIADISEEVWAIDSQYDPIASDSLDEAKIIRSNNRAVRKREVKAKHDRETGSKL